MRICFLGDAGSVHMHKWINYFKSIGWEVYVITFNPREIQGVKVITLGQNIAVKEKGGNFFYLLYISKIKKLIREIGPDIVNAHYITSYGLLGALTKTTIVAQSAWGTDILVTPQKNFLYRYATRFSLKKADVITSDSESMSGEIKKLLGKNKRPIVTVPMGIDNMIFRKKEEFKIDSPKLLSLRTLNDNSNIELIIKSFYKLLSCYPEARLTIGNDGPAKQRLVSMCDMYGISDKVSFTGFLSMEGVRDLMLENDYLLSVLKSDATSVTLLEGMSVGIYPIVSNIPANREWITDGINGKLVGFNEDEILKCILETYKDVELRKRAAEENNEIVVKKAMLNSNLEVIKNAFVEVSEKYKTKN